MINFCIKILFCVCDFPPACFGRKLRGKVPLHRILQLAKRKADGKPSRGTRCTFLHLLYRLSHSATQISVVYSTEVNYPYFKIQNFSLIFKGILIYSFSVHQNIKPRSLANMPTAGSHIPKLEWARKIPGATNKFQASAFSCKCFFFSWGFWLYLVGRLGKCSWNEDCIGGRGCLHFPLHSL